MTLLIDVGNSAIKWSLLDHDGHLVSPQRLLHRGAPDIASMLIKRWRGNVAPGTPMLACNVAGPRLTEIVEAAALALNLGTVRWLQSQARFNGPIVLNNGYRDPRQLGADRWHCMLGAGASAQFPLVVVNAGTATTVDCIDAVAEATPNVGEFIGGFIAPGMRLMLESLARETACLPAATGAATGFPDHTNAAIVSGVLASQVGMIHHVWHRFAIRLGTAPRLILTGGNAEELLSRLSIESAGIEHNLVLRGLALRAQFDLSDNPSR